MKPLKLSIIIPCLNEAEYIRTTLNKLQPLRHAGHEIILSDGGSSDNTLSLAQGLVDQCIQSAHGRAAQMNAGAALSTADVLCFLHADTLAPVNIHENISTLLSHSNKSWGRFNIRLSSSYWPYRIIEWLMNTRSCLSGIATGDQGIFVYREYFQQLDGYRDLPLMEDIELSRRLRKISRPLCIKMNPLITSSRRWENNGIVKTVLLMWQLRLRYFLGTPATVLASDYSTEKNKTHTGHAEEK